MKRLLVALSLFLVSCAMSEASICEAPSTLYPFQTVRVIDGDTVELMVDIGFQTFRQVDTRLYGVDTPEIYGVKKWADAEKTTYTEEYAKGKKASDFTAHWLDENCGDCRAETLGTGKYGRWIVKLYAPSGETLNDALLESGNAVVADY